MNEEENSIFVVRVKNPGAFELDIAFIIIISSRQYRLLCINGESVLFDGEYRTISKAKQTFAKFCKKRVINPERVRWTESYKPSSEWILSKLQLCGETPPVPRPATTPSRREVKISTLSNAVYFNSTNTFIICDVNYRLIILNGKGVLCDEYYPTFRGAKIAFTKLFFENAFNLGNGNAIKAEWTFPYPADETWLREKLEAVEKFHYDETKKAWKEL